MEIQTRIYPEQLSWVIDNMATRAIPKYFKETCDAWSQDRLAIHAGGTYWDTNGSVEYYLYPEVISENSNTIITQIYDNLIEGLKQRPHAKNFFVIFDNHSTQKSYSVIAFFEWIIRKFLNDCKFYIMFHVRGHTHNRLDMRNSKPRECYFKSERIETLPDYVCYNIAVIFYYCFIIIIL